MPSNRATTGQCSGPAEFGATAQKREYTAISASSSQLAPFGAPRALAHPAARSSVWTSLLLVTLAWIVLCWPWLVDGRIIPWDAKNHFYPILRFIAHSLHDGQSPAWNPYHMGGYPLISDPQSMLFSPIMLAVAALFDAPSMRVVDAAQLFHLLIGGAGIVLLCRSHGWHAAAGLLAALVFMFGGSAAARLQHTGMILSYGYLPLAFWLLKEALDRASVRFAIGFGVAAAIMAANRDQVAYLGCLALIGYGLYRFAEAEDRRGFLATRWRTVVAAGVAGLLVLALPLLVTLQLLGLSNRPRIAYDMAITGSLSPVNFLTLVAPDFFKSLDGFPDYWGPGGRGWHPLDWTDRSVDYLYLGLVPAVLFVWRGVLVGDLVRREIRFFAVLLAAATLYALGRYTPLFAPVFDHVPGVDLYRRPADATFIAGFAAALVSGFLLHRLITAPGQASRARAVLVGLGAAAAVVAGLVIAREHGELGHAARSLALAALLSAATWLLLRQAGRAGAWRAAWIAAVVLTLAIDLRVHNVGATFNAHESAPLAMYEGEEGDRLGAVLQEHLEQVADLDGPYRAEILGLGGAWQNAPMVFNIEATLGYNPMRLEAYQDATGASETSHESHRRFSALMSSYRSTLANLLGIRFVVTTVPIETIDPRLRPGDMQLVDRVGKARIYENARAFPRALLVQRAVSVDAERVLQTGVMPPIDFDATVLIEDLPEDWINPPPDPRQPRRGSVVLSHYSNTEVRLKVNAESPSFLVLNDLYYPFWHAYVDDEERQILKANILFRAVQVPPGEHTVVFRFEPLAIGGLLAALTGVDG